MPTPGVLQAADPQPQIEIQTLVPVTALPQPEPEPAPAEGPPALVSPSQQLIEEEAGPVPLPSIEQIIRDAGPPQTQIRLDYELGDVYMAAGWDGTRYTAEAWDIPGSGLVHWQVTTSYNNLPYLIQATNSANSSMRLNCVTYNPPQWTYSGTGQLTCTYPLEGSAYERWLEPAGQGAAPRRVDPLEGWTERERAALQASARQLGQRGAAWSTLAEEGAIHADIQAAAARVRELRAMRANATADIERSRLADQEARQQARQVAEERARGLLLEHLDAEQLASFEREQHFLVIVRSGRRYRIRSGWAGNVEEVREDGVAIARYCIHPTDYDIPVPDSLLAQLLLLQADERTFRQVANRTALRSA